MRKPHPNASALRKNMPSAEKRLWAFIRRQQLGAFKFRRQHTIGPYIADFVCVEAKLVVELDGGQHGFDLAEARDRTRDSYMEKEGWLVLRFWNGEVYRNIDGVLATVLDAAENGARERDLAKPVGQRPPPSAPLTPPLQAGEEEGVAANVWGGIQVKPRAD